MTHQLNNDSKSIRTAIGQFEDAWKTSADEAGRLELLKGMIERNMELRTKILTGSFNLPANSPEVVDFMNAVNDLNRLILRAKKELR